MSPPVAPTGSTSMMWSGHSESLARADGSRPAWIASAADLYSQAIMRMLPLGIGAMS